MNKKRVYNQTEVKYKISIYLSNCCGYQFKARNKGYVKIYVSNIWFQTYDEKLDINGNFLNFVNNFILYIILERICLEKGFQKIRIKGGSCNPKKDKEGYEYPCIGEYLLYKMGFKWE